MCFSSPSIPSAPAYTPPPVAQASQRADEAVTKARNDQQTRNRQAAGYNSTIKSGSTMGDQSTAPVATKRMTGE